MSIDIKTLRIGSHVLANGVRARVVKIDEPVSESEYPQCVILRFKAMINGELRCTGCLGDAERKVEPIAITPTLLTELGFKPDCDERLSELTYWRKIHKGYPLEMTYWGKHSNSQGRDWSIHIDNPDYETLGGMDVAYLHELETVVYIATGEELIEE